MIDAPNSNLNSKPFPFYPIFLYLKLWCEIKSVTHISSVNIHYFVINHIIYIIKVYWYFLI